MIEEIMASADHQWFVGEMDPAEKEKRKKAAEEFKKRYSQ
jgi:hypothetical protein